MMNHTFSTFSSDSPEFGIYDENGYNKKGNLKI